MSTFKDLFSNQSSDYAQFRPTYPQELFAYLAGLASEKKAVWDCGTGNGQAALELAQYFETVWATDPSEKQLQNAKPNPHIHYSQASAEDSHLKDHSVDLVTVAQAFHWFRQNDFLKEAQRVSKPGGILAIWCYRLAEITPEIDAVVFKLYDDILGPYWDPERKMVDEGYENVQYPLVEIKAPEFSIQAQWSLEHLVGYLSTWSALQKYLKQNSQNPIELVFEDLQRAWGSSELRPVRWPMGLRIWKLS